MAYLRRLRFSSCASAVATLAIAAAPLAATAGAPSATVSGLPSSFRVVQPAQASSLPSGNMVVRVVLRSRSVDRSVQLRATFRDSAGAIVEQTPWRTVSVSSHSDTPIELRSTASGVDGAELSFRTHRSSGGGPPIFGATVTGLVGPRLAGASEGMWAGGALNVLGWVRPTLAVGPRASITSALGDGGWDGSATLEGRLAISDEALLGLGLGQGWGAGDPGWRVGLSLSTLLVDDSFTLPIGLRLDVQPGVAVALLELGAGLRAYRRE